MTASVKYYISVPKIPDMHLLPPPISFNDSQLYVMPQCPQFCGHIVLPRVIMAVAVVLLSWQYYSINTPDTATKRQQSNATSLHPFTIRSSLFLSLLALSSPPSLSIPPSPTKYVHIDPLTLPHPSLFPSLSLFYIFSIDQLSPFLYLTPSLFPFHALFFIISHFIFPHHPCLFFLPMPSLPPSSLACIFFFLFVSVSLTLHINWCIFAAEQKKKVGGGGQSKLSGAGGHATVSHTHTHNRQATIYINPVREHINRL